MTKALSVIKEGSDFDGTWQAFWVGSDLLQGRGCVFDTDSTDTLLFKGLNFPDEARQHCTVTPINGTRKTFWENSYYFDNHLDAKKFVALVAICPVVI